MNEREIKRDINAWVEKHGNYLFGIYAQLVVQLAPTAREILKLLSKPGYASKVKGETPNCRQMLSLYRDHSRVLGWMESAYGIDDREMARIVRQDWR